MICPFRNSKNIKKDLSFKNMVVTTETTHFGKCYEKECPFFTKTKDGSKICLRGRAKINIEDI